MIGERGTAETVACGVWAVQVEPGCWIRSHTPNQQQAVLSLLQLGFLLPHCHMAAFAALTDLVHPASSRTSSLGHGAASLQQLTWCCGSGEASLLVGVHQPSSRRLLPKALCHRCCLDRNLATHALVLGSVAPGLIGWTRTCLWGWSCAKHQTCVHIPAVPRRFQAGSHGLACVCAPVFNQLNPDLATRECAPS